MVFPAAVSAVRLHLRLRRRRRRRRLRLLLLALPLRLEFPTAFRCWRSCRFRLSVPRRLWRLLSSLRRCWLHCRRWHRWHHRHHRDASVSWPLSDASWEGGVHGGTGEMLDGPAMETGVLAEDGWRKKRTQKGKKAAPCADSDGLHEKKSAEDRNISVFFFLSFFPSSSGCSTPVSVWTFPIFPKTSIPPRRPSRPLM